MGHRTNDIHSEIECLVKQECQWNACVITTTSAAQSRCLLLLGLSWKISSRIFTKNTRKKCHFEVDIDRLILDPRVFKIDSNQPRHVHFQTVFSYARRCLRCSWVIRFPPKRVLLIHVCVTCSTLLHGLQRNISTDAEFWHMFWPVWRIGRAL